MKIFRFGLLLLALCFSVGSMAQVNKWQDIYKVKKNERSTKVYSLERSFCFCESLFGKIET